ncbi:CPBP family intramembrane metalloprotease [Rhodococcus sp. ABRD24]|uniref:CPBP family intramembrane glutamic endopeptidase n=1 Tax=Rhodococcus sp. ABRD24 TaxID=2507582 RepID=UPI00103A8C7F|nr:CPBP family intramembrane glutamic endopeptidase [Rhodococcus sp. ABRD24]QBJ95991.1 CPBP family intramembrane metalloprotease [Rhodococcus sp. ABRD24]
MFERLSDRTSAIIFSILVLAISLCTANVAEGLVLAISPLLAVLVMLLVVTREGYGRAGWRRLGMGKLGLRYWPLALITTAGVSALAIVGVVGVGAASFTMLSGDWLQTTLVLCITGPILAFAEEIGWRGYLQPRLAFLGKRWAMLTVGVIWIGWHLPYILLTSSYHAEGERLIVLTLFSGSVIAFSFVFGYLRLLSDSVWPAVLAHFAHNATFAVLATYAITTDRPVLVNEYLAGDTGLFVLIGTLICALAIALRARTVTPRPSERFLQQSWRG